MTVFSYRGIARPANETNIVRVDQRNKLSPRGRRIGNTVTMYLMGEIVGTGSDLLTSCRALIDQFRNDYGDAVLALDDGTLTPHQLTNSNSVSGVRVIHRSWSKGDAAELATTRTYSVALQADYDDCEDQIVFWTETLKYVGNTGPRFDIIDTFNGPVSVLTAQFTAQRIVQYGRAIGYSAHPLPPGSLFPSYEHQDQREVELVSGQNQGQAARFFETRWVYRHTSNVSLDTVPNTL
jgi:hypothetical protein